MGYNVFHAYPQAFKLNVIKPLSRNGRRFDALVRLEEFDAGLSAIARLANTRFIPQSARKRVAHSTDLSPCDDIDLQSDPRLARRLCQLYAVDYECFGYVWPNVCG